jgi:putative ABC transport system permease protein
MLNDLKYAIRSLLRAPGFTSIAVLTLALGIGATTAMYSVVQAAVIRPVPYPDPDRLVLISERLDKGQRARLTALDFGDIEKHATSFEAIAAHAGTGFTFTGDGDAEMVLGQLTTAGIFDVLKTRPARGRSYTPDETEAGRDTVAVVSHGLWQRRFGGDPNVIDRVVSINGKRFVVIGVMPERFEYPHGRYVLWTPLALRGASDDGPPVNRTAHYIQAVARLKPGVTMAQAQQELDALSKQFAAAHPHRNLSLRLEPLADAVAGPTRPALLLLLAGVICLLLIACANVTGLLLARATARAGELTVRAALGASGWRLARLLLTETAVLYALGGTAGVLLAAWALEAVRRFGPEDVPRLAAAAVDRDVLFVAAAVTLVPAILFGALPNLRFAARGARRAGDTRTTSASVATNRARSGLVVAQLALSLVLLVTAGLVGRTFYHLRQIDNGFDVEGVVTFSLVMPNTRYPEATQMMATVDRLVEAFSARAGVMAVGATTALPLSGQNVENGFTVDGYEPPPGMGVIGGLRAVNADYFRALGSPMLSGRGFGAGDTMRSEPVVIVNERFARQYLAQREPVGTRVRMGGADSQDPWRRVVGVVADVRHAGPAEEVRPEVFFPYHQMDPDFLTTWGRGLYVAIRTTGHSDAVVGSVRRAVRSIDPELPVNDLQPMQSLLADAVSQPRFRLFLFGGFAAVAAILAAVGLFGVMAFFVAHRTREIGIRLALGASVRDVAGLIGWRAARMALLGVALGLLGAAAARSALQSILVGISPLDPLTFGLATVVLLCATAAAAYIPARRAIHVDPITALRAE